MTQVIKRGGRKQAFNATKIRNSIRKAAREARLSPKKVETLVKEVAEPAIAFFKKKRKVKAADIRRSVLRRIERRAKSVVRAWRRHEKKKKKR